MQLIITLLVVYTPEQNSTVSIIRPFQSLSLSLSLSWNLYNDIEEILRGKLKPCEFRDKSKSLRVILTYLSIILLLLDVHKQAENFQLGKFGKVFGRAYYYQLERHKLTQVARSLRVINPELRIVCGDLILHVRCNSKRFNKRLYILLQRNNL